MTPTLPLTRDLVLIGGGHAHALVLKQWAMRPLPGARLTLIDPDPTAAYTGMLPGFVAGHYVRSELDIDLIKLARAAGARIILAPVTGLDPDARRIAIEGRAPIRFDVASIDIGATGRAPDIPGFSDHVVTAKPLARFADRWADFVERAPNDESCRQVSVIGGGAAGVELALAAQHRLSTLGRTPSMTLLEVRDQIAPDLTGGARRALKAALGQAGVRVITGAVIEEITADAIKVANATIETDFIIGAAGVQPWPWVADTDLQLTEGWISVDAQLRSISHPHIFAAGDCAHLTTAPRPKAGVFAVRAAPVLADNLRAALQGRSAKRSFKPQRDYLKLISTGRQSAVAEKFGLAVEAPALWQLKDRIDKAFMERLGDLKPMARPRVGGPMAAGVKALADGAQPLCGGCGSKTGRSALSEGLRSLANPMRDDVLAGSGDDAAVLKAGEMHQVITTDHLRAFVDDPGLFARITAVHALGDIWSTGAQSQAALATIILPAMAENLQAAMVAEITEAAGSVFRDAGADIVGGHTSSGAELSLGFTITGLTGKPALQGGARPGDVLVLTKPIGTGVILAADMALRAHGRDIANCWASMARPQDKAAALLGPVATSMTDVTGFGLAGHLVTLLGQETAELDLNTIPLLEGARELATSGVRSTLFKANRLAPEILDPPDSPISDLLIDPQTAGGMLAAIPERDAEKVFQAFAKANEPIWRIGRVTKASTNSPKIIAR